MGAALSAPSNALGGYVSDRLNNPPLVIGGALAILATTAFLLVQVQSLPLLLVFGWGGFCWWRPLRPAATATLPLTWPEQPG